MALNETREKGSENTRKGAEAYSIRLISDQAKMKPFDIGEFVYAKSNEIMLSKLSRKFIQKFIEVLPNDRYEVEKLSGKGGATKFAHGQLSRQVQAILLSRV